MSNGWMPDVEHVPTPNFTIGNAGRRAVVLHIMDGAFQSSIDWMRKAGTSAHFDISKSGRIVQQVSINDTAWGNGLVYRNGRWYTLRENRYTLVKPTWPLLAAGENPNSSTISIEHEGHPGEPLTPEQLTATIRVLRWVGHEAAFLYVPGVTLIGHFNLDNVGRARCPGPAFDFAAIAAAANATPDRRTFRVRYAFGANVRQGPAATFPIALDGHAVLPQRATFAADKVVDGTPFNGDARWVHLADGLGFVHWSAVEEV